jgi:glycosyltransferase involved in cell wall biosynthesis
VLHVGNVANNGYLNAKLLNDAGCDCDVLAYAHYHTMGCPEWEESDFEGVVDEARPDWRAVDLRGFTRPRWFAQGPIADAAAYLETRRAAPPGAAARWWWLELRRDLITGGRWSWLRSLKHGAATATHASAAAAPPPPGDGVDDASAADADRYAARRQWPLAALARLFSRYDVVHAYGAEPILPMLTGTRPYVAFEHGTLRALPFEPTAEGRLTAAAYRKADAVLITNADNRHAAERLGLTQYRFVPHPINELVPERGAVERLRRDLAARLDADFIVFHPSRHHWGPERYPHLEKGNDLLIDGLQQLFADQPRAAAVFVAWGQRLAETRARLAAAGIGHRVAWIDPVPGPALARYMAACDVVADQFFLGAFGAITPRALFLGTPPLLHLDFDAHRWCFPEPPPVLNARTPSEIAQQLRRVCVDRDGLAELGRRGRAWYAKYHAREVVTRTLMTTYSTVLAAPAI